jgi:hypothetical protein
MANPVPGPDLTQRAGGFAGTRVRVGALPAEPPDAYAEPAADATSIFDDYEIRSKFLKQRQTWMLPVAKPTGFGGQSAAFVQLAAPTLVWVCDWTVRKTGAPPEVPDPTSRDPNWVFLYELWEPNMIELNADGATPTYRLSGCYLYGAKTPQSETYLDVKFPRPPWMDDVFPRTIGRERLVAALSEPAGGLVAGFAANARIVP